MQKQLSQLYNRIKTLGRGAFGEVHLVQDKKTKQLYALKVLDLNLLKDEEMLEYLQSQIQCMKNTQSPYILKLYNTFQDQQNKMYMVLQYCNGGDLLCYQARQKGIVFKLERALQILSQVLKGLYDLHEAGYLHRDIKPQNILVKKEGDKETFKLADFGFSKKKNKIKGTICGTDQFMSPQVFGNKNYGFQVDMWSFGIVFFYMLNAEYPFKLNPNLEVHQKAQKLNELSKKFNYSTSVSQTKKNLIENCNQEVQDLFSKIFCPDADKRITFAQIREHKLFAKFFQTNDLAATRKFYSKKYQNNILASNVSRLKVSFYPKKAPQEDGDIQRSQFMSRPENKKFPQHSQTLLRKKDEIDFLRQNAEHFYDREECYFFQQSHRLALAFNLFKYYIILLRNFKKSLNPVDLKKQYIELDWQQFCRSKQFNDLKSECQEDLTKYQNKFSQIYEECTYTIEDIKKSNPRFSQCFKKQIQQTQFDNQQSQLYKESYRRSTMLCFNAVIQKIKLKSPVGNKLHYNLTLISISHMFNRIFTQKQQIQQIFKQYLTIEKEQAQKMDFNKLRRWMQRAKTSQLAYIVRAINKVFF